MKKIVVLTTLLALAGVSTAYRRSDLAFCFIGGLNSSYGNLGRIPRTIRDTYPGIPFVELKNGDGSRAATQIGLYKQLNQLYEFAKNEPTLTGKDVILIGGSQGGLLAQAFIEMYRDKLPFNIIVLMTLASPLAGQYGLNDDWESMVTNTIQEGGTPFLQKIAESVGINRTPIALKNNEVVHVSEALSPETSALSKQTFDTITNLVKIAIQGDFSLLRFIFYNPIGQDLISLAGFWRDPMRKEEYLSGNKFLPLINNEIAHTNAARYKTNIMALDRIVFFWAGKDATVKPSCSGSKRFYKWGSTTDLESSFEETNQYKDNLLGLKTMLEAGRLFIEYLPNDGHSCESDDAVERMLKHIRAIVESE